MKEFCFIAVVCGFLPGGACADPEVALATELTMVAAVSGCAASTVFTDDPHSCVGVSYDTCMPFTAGSHSDQGNCLYLEAQIWESPYQTALLGVLRKAQEQDSNPVNLGLTRFGQFQRVLNAESVWHEYVTSQCNFEMTKWGAGTIVMTERPYCEMRLIVDRIVFLRDFAKPQR